MLFCCTIKAAVLWTLPGRLDWTGVGEKKGTHAQLFPLDEVQSFPGGLAQGAREPQEHQAGVFLWPLPQILGTFDCQDDLRLLGCHACRGKG